MGAGKDWPSSLKEGYQAFKLGRNTGKLKDKLTRRQEDKMYKKKGKHKSKKGGQEESRTIKHKNTKTGTFKVIQRG